MRLDDDSLDDALATVLREHPDAPVVAVTPAGVARDLPDGFDPGGRRVLPPGAALAFVPRSERGAVLDAWARARDTGMSVTLLRFEERSDAKGTLYVVDMTHRYGAYIAVLVPEDGAAIEMHPIEVLREPTRMGRLHKDAISTIVDVDDGAGELLGFAPEELLGRRAIDLLHPDDHDRAIDCWMAMLADPRGIRMVRARHLREDGSYVWVDISNRNLLDAPEATVVTDIVDVSEEMQAQEALRGREQLLGRLTEALPLGVLQIERDRDVVFANGRFHEIVGSDPHAPLDEQLGAIVTSDRRLLDAALDDVLQRGMDQDLRVRLERAPGQPVRLLQLALRTLTNGVGAVTGAVACVEDVTERARLQLELATRAMQDALTGCSNRAATLGRLHDVLVTAAPRAGTEIVLIYFDIDNFKEINDALGHAAGDEVLRVVARRVGQVVRDHDVVGRLGGDEFLVVCPGLGGEDEAMTVARRMVDEVHRPVSWKGEGVDVRISTGVVWCASTSVDPEWLVAEADRAMYESKRLGDGSPVGRLAEARDPAPPPVSNPLRGHR